MAEVKKKTLTDTYTHRRGWGSEYWITNNEMYCGKLLVIEAGKRCSLHFHALKHETMFLEEGRVDLLMIDPETGKEYTVELFPGDSIEIRNNQVHQIIAHVKSTVIEFSTPHYEEDSYRVRKGD